MTGLLTLANLEIGKKAVITKISPNMNYRTRYAGMGLLRNSAVEVTRVAPLGDPIILRIRGYELSLRKEEASNIEISLQN